MVCSDVSSPAISTHLIQSRKLTGLSVRTCKEVVSLFGDCYAAVESQGEGSNGSTSRAEESRIAADVVFYKALFESAQCERACLEASGTECIDGKFAAVVEETAVSQSKFDDAFSCGSHLSPEQWHSMLESADPGEVILFDARNQYETAIGHFTGSKDGMENRADSVAPSIDQAVGGVERIDPMTRQFTDLPRYLVKNREQIREKMCGKKVLMYCTGGVRCERASQLLRLVLSRDPSEASAHCDGRADDSRVADQVDAPQIFQLAGGIHAYLEQQPEGGFFRGHNFVFDQRMAVGGCGGVGGCIECGRDWDDYTSAHARCGACRMRVLLCPACAGSVERHTIRCALCIS